MCSIEKTTLFFLYSLDLKLLELLRKVVEAIFIDSTLKPL